MLGATLEEYSRTEGLIFSFCGADIKAERSGVYCGSMETVWAKLNKEKVEMVSEWEANLEAILVFLAAEQ